MSDSFDDPDEILVDLDWVGKTFIERARLLPRQKEKFNALWDVICDVIIARDHKINVLQNEIEKLKETHHD